MKLITKRIISIALAATLFSTGMVFVPNTSKMITASSAEQVYDDVWWHYTVPLSNRNYGYGSKYISKGDSVKFIQAYCNYQHCFDYNGRPLEVDGNYGPKTKYAVKCYQKVLNKSFGKKILAEDGVFGPNTFKAGLSLYVQDYSGRKIPADKFGD